MREHDDEPVPGLPEPLPAGERLLWQGAPQWRSVAQRVLHVRKLAIYFAAALAWYVAEALADGRGAVDAALASSRFALLAVGALGLLGLISWLIARTTLYTVTDRRVVMRFGIALSMTVNIPFRVVDGAAVDVHGDGTGDVLLELAAGQRLAYLVMWPHVRPWRVSRPQPMLRGVADAGRAAEVLARALAAYTYDPSRGAAGVESVATPSAAARRPASAVA